jgi:hypothetical protein
MEVFEANINSSTKARGSWPNKDSRILGKKNEVANGVVGSKSAMPLCTRSLADFSFPRTNHSGYLLVFACTLCWSPTFQGSWVLPGRWRYFPYQVSQRGSQLHEICGSCCSGVAFVEKYEPDMGKSHHGKAEGARIMCTSPSSLQVPRSTRNPLNKNHCGEHLLCACISPLLSYCPLKQNAAQLN